MATADVVAVAVADEPPRRKGIGMRALTPLLQLLSRKRREEIQNPMLLLVRMLEEEEAMMINDI